MVIFAALRILFWYVLLFGVLSPIFLPGIQNLNSIKRLIYSWVGMGGILLVGILGLTLFDLYDYIGLLALLVTIPLLRLWYRSDKNKGTSEYLHNIENRFIVWQVRAIESATQGRTRRWLRKKSEDLENAIASIKEGVSWNFIVICVAVVGSLIRLIPALRNAAPFSNNSLYILSRIKDIGIQNFWGQTPEPAGAYAIINLFSLLSQVKPEMVIHLFGALISFLLSITIYWSIDTILDGKSPFAALFGMTLFVLFSTTLMPISLGQQITADGLYLALIFGLPTIIIYGQYLYTNSTNLIYLVFWGLIATGLMNLFVYLVIVLPLLIIEWLYFVPGFNLKSWISKSSVIWSNVLVLGIIYSIPIIYRSLSPIDFIKAQLLNTNAFVFKPNLVFSIGKLATFCAVASGLLLLIYSIEWFLKKGSGSAKYVFILFFLLVTALYIPPLQSEALWVDYGQLNPFYAVLIAIFGGLVFATLVNWIRKLFNEPKVGFWASGAFFCVTIGSLIWLQGGIKTHNELPDIEPDGFYRAYYRIIQNRLPWTYSIVAPDADQSLSKNRHYFMDYDYFLSSYSKIDSLYQVKLRKEKHKKTLSAKEAALLPSASIFVFVAKPPYNDIRLSVNFNPAKVMPKVKHWLENYRKKPGRKLNIYYESPDAIVYEIDNQSDKSRVHDLLYDINPSDLDNTTN